MIIKLVVFFSFWQGFLLSILGYFNLIGSQGVATYSTRALAGSIQDLLICIECLPAALAFANAFPAKDYMRPGEQPGTIFENIVNMFDVRDIRHDMSELVEDQVRTVAPGARPACAGRCSHQHVSRPSTWLALGRAETYRHAFAAFRCRTRACWQPTASWRPPPLPASRSTPSPSQCETLLARISRPRPAAYRRARTDTQCSLYLARSSRLSHEGAKVSSALRACPACVPQTPLPVSRPARAVRGLG